MTRPLPVLAALAILSGCAATVKTRVQTDGPGLPSGATIMLFAPEAGRKPAEAALAPVIERVLAANGHTVAPDAPLVLDYAVSERPATIGVAADKAAADGTQPWLSSPRGAAGCKARMIRLSVTIASKADGRALYRGSAEERHCRATLDTVGPMLAESALADLAKPAGIRLVKRAGQN